MARTRVRISVTPLETRKVAGYGLPGLFAKQCNVKVVRVQLPCLPLVGSINCRSQHGSMVKRTSSLASNEKFQVRFLVELLKHRWKGKPNGDGTRLEAGRACMTSLEGSTPSPSAAIETFGDNDRLPSWSTCFRSRMSWVRIPPARL